VFVFVCFVVFVFCIISCRYLLHYNYWQLISRFISSSSWTSSDNVACVCFILYYWIFRLSFGLSIHLYSTNMQDW